MMKRRIAVLISLMLAAPAAVVALEQATSPSAASDPAAVSVTTEAPAPATEASAATEAPAETTAAEPQRIVVAERSPAPERQAATNPVSRFFANIQQARTSDAFPEGSMDGDWALNPLPSQQQYFVRLEEQRANMFARMEQERMARLQPQPAVTPAPVSSSDQSAQAGSSEVAIADTSAIR